jgi:hypothetical protein
MGRDELDTPESAIPHSTIRSPAVTPVMEQLFEVLVPVEIMLLQEFTTVTVPALPLIVYAALDVERYSPPPHSP